MCRFEWAVTLDERTRPEIPTWLHRREHAAMTVVHMHRRGDLNAEDAVESRTGPADPRSERFFHPRSAQTRGCREAHATASGETARHGIISPGGVVPRREQVLFANRIEDLQRKGPIRREWRNSGKRSENEYHCHLSYSWVACRRVEKQVLEIEVYYAGRRQNAPY